ncbi:ATP-binding protein [Orientia tsutsugamushi]|uniref:ATP-binding protein n=1 Tax=Orientia tsutsugamushi TaxID=784 RepID=A0A2U3QUW1_ORITS|nr:putative signal transduction histidine kinase domain protein [Orientia tsutsugamushi str. UT76]SPR04743.1 ATP-binding protein [Orientia tsutsugamushi]
MSLGNEGQNKINKLTEKLSTEGINSTTIKQIDVWFKKN